LCAKRSHKFLLKIAFTVMLFLILYVPLHDLNLRRTDAESSVSLLPGKAIPHPPGRASFELLNRMGKGAGACKAKMQMNVIRRSTRGHKRETLAARNAAQVGMEFGGAGGWYQRTTLFGAEDTWRAGGRPTFRF
jgi:hypothetical protein